METKDCKHDCNCDEATGGIFCPAVRKYVDVCPLYERGLKSPGERP